MAEWRFPKENHLREAFLLDRSHPALRVGVQIRWSRWHALTPGCVDDLLKGGALFPIAVVDQVLPGRQKPPRLHSGLTIVATSCKACFPSGQPQRALYARHHSSVHDLLAGCGGGDFRSSAGDDRSITSCGKMSSNILAIRVDALLDECVSCE